MILKLFASGEQAMGKTVLHLKAHWHHGFFLLLMSLFILTSAHANTTNPDPDVLLKQATHDMIAAINANRKEIKTNPDKLKSLVEEIILPHLDLITASKWVMGKYWRRADKAQKLGFIRAFRTLLLRFYSSALAEYLNEDDKLLDQKIFTYYPIRGDLASKDVQVRAIVSPEKGDPVPIHYSMHLTSKGWKIYDVSVDGVSMITTYKNNFATELSQKGIDGLIASIEEKNKNMVVDKVEDLKKKI
jgi:phospholipid transport system substrate-binding protein